MLRLNGKENKLLTYNLIVCHKEEEDASLPFKMAPKTDLDHQLMQIVPLHFCQ